MEAMANFSKVYCAELEGIEAKLIEVETDINVGLHSFNIVGLADKALNEAKERVNAALKNSNIKSPGRENRKITVNLAPADIKKAGSQYDAAIAIGYLLASKQIKSFNPGNKIFVGELSLEGNLRPVSGILAISCLAKNLGFEYVFVPRENAVEAAIISGIKIIPISTLSELINHLEERSVITPQKKTELEFVPKHGVDISEIKGQENAKRALTIAAAGGHNLIMIGSPGAGKTMLAQALVSILPPLSVNEVVEVTRIYSSSGVLKGSSFITARPFRAPHHTASAVSVVGGGANPKPGEISLAHRGILFLDEIPEFRRDLLESLRQPLESGSVCVSRAKGVLNFPARFTLVAAMNPCPCGYFGDNEKACRCSAHEVFRYQKKISGPLLDRIDLQLEVPRVKVEELRKNKEENTTNHVIAKVINARKIQEERFKKLRQEIYPHTQNRGNVNLDSNKNSSDYNNGLGVGVYLNSEMSSKMVDKVIDLDNESQMFLKNILEKSFISARGYYRILKTARTIADLEESEKVGQQHLAEAFQYRIRES